MTEDNFVFSHVSTLSQMTMTILNYILVR